ncbi:hypothetical protein BHE74_00025124, partial [Ensete ventricosum]
ALALLHPHCIAVAIAPTQAVATLCGRQPPYQGVATPATGAAAPVGDRAGHGQQPLASWPPLAGSQAMAGAPAGGLAMASHLFMQTTCMWPPLPRRKRLLSLSIATISA